MIFSENRYSLFGDHALVDERRYVVGQAPLLPRLRVSSVGVA
jgi:hypothetical protein